MEEEGFPDDDSFLEEEPSTGSSQKGNEDQKQSGSLRRCSPPSPPFVFDETGNAKDSFVTALENQDDLASPPPENLLEGGMSTIEEESRSYHTSTGASISRRVFDEQKEADECRDDPDKMVETDKSDKEDSYRNLNESQEFRDLQQLVKETAEEFKESVRPIPSVLMANNLTDSTFLSSATSTNPNASNRSLHEDEGLEALLLKLEKLESAQNVLEDALNAGSTDDIDIEALIAQLPVDPSKVLTKSTKEEEEDQSQRSFSSEIASIQKIIDGSDMSFSMNLEVAGGNNNKKMVKDGSSNKVAGRRESEENIFPSQGQRSVEDVLKEYEEFERTLSRATVTDESFRSDISSAPPLSAYSNNEIVTSVPDKLIQSTHFLSPIKSVVESPPIPSASPVIKPAVLKNSASVPPTGAPIATSASSTSNFPQMSFANSTRQFNHHQSSEGSTSRTRPMTAAISKGAGSGSRSSRLEASHSAHGIQQHSQGTTQSARSTASATATSARSVNQDALNKGRNRRMRSPRTMTSPAPNDSFSNKDIPNSSSARGGGEGYFVSKKEESTSPQKRTHQHSNKSRKETMDAVVAAEALKTIEKLNTMVARQETLLDAFSKDNEKLWGQLKEAKSESQEKEGKFQDVINSLKTEVATLKLNRLVTAPAYNPPPPVSPSRKNRAELQRVWEDSELKSQQILELRKEILLLQSKLSSRQPRSPSKPNRSTKEQLASQEKEKEFQKTINGLNKQVRTLQRILYSKDESAPPPPPDTLEGNKGKLMQRTKSDITRQSVTNSNCRQQQPQRISLKNSGIMDAPRMSGRKVGGATGKPVNIKTGDVLQASLNCIEQEREEFENIIADKNRVIFDKEKLILGLKEEIDSLKTKIPDGEVVERGMIEELRSRIITQNQVIQTLKQHMSTFKKLEAENILLREEKRSLEQLGKDLRRKLESVQYLVKPENEVLSLLSEKVDELNSRYYQRERQLDNLLNRLTVKTTTGELISSSSSNDGCNSVGGYIHSVNLSPLRRLPLDQFNNNNASLGGFQVTSSSSIGGKGRSTGLTSADILNMVDISPSSSFQHFNTLSNLPEM